MFDPEKIARNCFSTDLSTIGCQFEHIQNPHESDFRKVIFFKMAAKPSHFQGRAQCFSSRSDINYSILTYDSLNYSKMNCRSFDVS